MNEYLPVGWEKSTSFKAVLVLCINSLHFDAFFRNKISSKCLDVTMWRYWFWQKYWGRINFFFFAHLNALEDENGQNGCSNVTILFLCIPTESLRTSLCKNVNFVMIYSPSCRSFLLNNSSYWAGLSKWLEGQQIRHMVCVLCFY